MKLEKRISEIGLPIVDIDEFTRATFLRSDELIKITQREDGYSDTILLSKKQIIALAEMIKKEEEIQDV